MERKPINSRERAQIMRLGVAIGMLQETAADERIAMVKNGKRDLALIRSVSKKLFAALGETLPMKQLLQIQQNVKHMSCYVGVVKIPEHQKVQQYGMFLTHAACRAFFVASEDHCRMCMLDKHKQKKCELRAALDELRIKDVEGNGTEAECPYYKL